MSYFFNNQRFHNIHYTPFLLSPKGEKMKNLITPSPVGEGWDGGKIHPTSVQIFAIYEYSAKNNIILKSLCI
jgi:hypothetical protein